MQAPPPPARLALRLIGWAMLVWIVIFWRLGYPSFWDPGDEAHYAQASREMWASGNLLVPTYNGHLFPDKPVLFYWLQIAAYAVFGPTEFAARLPPACSALALFLVTAWFARRWLGPDVADNAVGALAVLPATFALSSYAILDMTFTAFLFAAWAALLVGARDGRRRLEFAGYVCLAAALMTKGPLALVLTGVALILGYVVCPEFRPHLRRLSWIRGLAFTAAICAPWFAYMWWWFGDAFIDGYALRENILLYTRGLTSDATAPRAGSSLSYTRVLLVGLLPWTPVLAGRLVDAARGFALRAEERMLLAAAAAVFLFFSFSSFKLDHYLYPLVPPLCVLVAAAWRDARAATVRRPVAGTIAGVVVSAVMLAGAGLALIPQVRRVPLQVGYTVEAMSFVLFACGSYFLVRLARHRFRLVASPAAFIVALLAAYALVLVRVLPEFEAMKPVKNLAQWTATQAPPEATVASYRMDRWTTSWRFYVERFVDELKDPEDLDRFLGAAEPRYCLMMERDYEQLKAQGYPLQRVQEGAGLDVTSGRALTRRGGDNVRKFLVVRKIEAAAPAIEPPAPPDSPPASDPPFSRARRARARWMSTSALRTR